MMNPNLLLQFKEISSVFLFFLFCFSSMGLALDADPRPQDCEPKDCGNGLNVSYPFWITDLQPSYCGYPNFELTCKIETPVLTISNQDYYVQQIFYENKSILLSNAEFENSTCLYPQHGLALELSPFKIAFASEKLLLFFINCTVTLPADYFRIDCASVENKQSFVRYSLPTDQPDVSKKCESVVSYPYEWYPGENIYNYQESLKNSLLLNWTAADCGTCKESGGRCGYNNITNKFMCICNDRPHEGSCKWKGTSTTPKIIIGACAAVVGFIGVCGGIYFYYRRKKNKYKSAFSTSLSRTASSEYSKKDPEFGTTHYQTHVFSYKELHEATDGFASSKELGDGGFGTVYHGKLRDGRVVAVKRLYENNYKRLEQFMNEIEILNRLRHQNLVTLYGCTSRHSRELLLVYEYVPNGTVADHLHGPLAGGGALTWPIRMSIAIETADALAYLHAVEPQIIHRDVKTNNILLDNNFRVKVADFGLSRLFPLDATHVSTAPQGTPGYVDPEYHQCYQLTDKSDVYSFGVVLVELISSKPAVDISRHRHEINLASMAVNKIQNGLLQELVDPGIGFESDSGVKRMVTLMAELAFRCLQGEKEMRPSMEEALDVLKGIEDGDYKAEKPEADVSVRDDSTLLKNGMPFSPDSVADKWVSSSTTPNTSGG